MTETGASVALTASATPAALDLVQDRLAELWQGHPDVSAQDRARFEMGLVEILANVVEHAYRHDDGSAGADGRELSVVVTVTDEVLAAELGDNGRPVEIDLSEVTLPDGDAESGRGLALALASLDHLEHRREQGRNLWLLRCVRRPA